MNWNRALSGACAASLLSSVAAPAFAQQLEAHEHGQASGQLAVESGLVSLRLRMPGFNLVGFEHPPRNQDQQLRYDRALKRLDEGAWLRSPPAARCVTTRLEIHAPGFGAASPDPHDDGHDPEHHGHDRHDDHHHDGHADDHHDHDHHNDGQHAEFEIEMELECAQPARLAWIELDLFEGWYDNQRLRLDVLTETMVRQFDLRAGAGRVELQ